MAKRECAKCHIDKPRSEFSANQLKKNLAESTCKACVDGAWASPAVSGGFGLTPSIEAQNAMLQALLMQQALAQQQGYERSLDPAELALACRPVLDPAAAQQSLSLEQCLLAALPSAEPAAKRICSMAAKMAVPDLQEMNLTFPRVVVFDLDDTCWKHGLDRKGAKGPPYTWCPRQHTLVDKGGQALTILPDLLTILYSLSQAGVPIAIASHNSKPAWCNEAMDKFLLDDASGLFWGDLVAPELRVINCNTTHWPLKNKHLEDIAENAPGGPCALREMVLFDDGKKICNAAEVLGVTAVRTPDGITLAHFMEAMRTFSSRALLQQRKEAGLKKTLERQQKESAIIAARQVKAAPIVSSGTLL